MRLNHYLLAAASLILPINACQSPPIDTATPGQPNNVLYPKSLVLIWPTDEKDPVRSRGMIFFKGQKDSTFAEPIYTMPGKANEKYVLINSDKDTIILDPKSKLIPFPSQKAAMKWQENLFEQFEDKQHTLPENKVLSL